MRLRTELAIRLLCAFAFASAPISVSAEVDLAERQYHWDLLYEYRAAMAKVDPIIGFCTNYDADVDLFLRENTHYFEFSFMSVVQAYETHSLRWWEAIKSVSGSYAEGAGQADELIDSTIWGDSPTEADLCDKLLWVYVVELEEVVEEMKKELDARRVAYVEPMGLSRLWKNKEDNPWSEVVEAPYSNLKKLFDGNPYKPDSTPVPDLSEV